MGQDKARSAIVKKEDIYFALTGLTGLAVVFWGVYLNIFSPDMPLIMSIWGFAIFAVGLALKSRMKSNFNYFGRLFFHSVGGSFLILLGLWFSKNVLVLSSLALFSIFLTNLILTIKGIKTSFYQSMNGGMSDLRHTHYYSGTLWLFSYVAVAGIFDTIVVYPALFSLALGDATASLVGRLLGRHKNPLNRCKSIEGSLAFFCVSAFFGMFFITPTCSIIGAITGTLVESLSNRIDDNLTVPFSVAVILMLANHFKL